MFKLLDNKNNLITYFLHSEKLNKHFSSKKNTGFTLIELLVVIAIIGILLAIIVVGVSSSRAQGRDAAILSYLGQIKSEAELIQIQSSSYNSLCAPVGDGLNTTISTLNTIHQSVLEQLGDAKCFADAESYCVYSALNSSGFFCLDSTGRSEIVSVHQCQPGNFTCQ